MFTFSRVHSCMFITVHFHLFTPLPPPAFYSDFQRTYVLTNGCDNPITTQVGSDVKRSRTCAARLW